MCGWLCVSCLRNPESLGVLSSLAGRNVQRRLLQQYMCGGLCVSCLGNPKSVRVLSSLPVRNVQRTAACSSICVWGLCVSGLRNPESVGVLSSLACKKCTAEVACSNVCGGGLWMFLAFVIQNLWVCSVVSLQEMYNVSTACSSVCGGWLCVSYLCNSESVGGAQQSR